MMLSHRTFGRIALPLLLAAVALLVAARGVSQASTGKVLTLSEALKTARERQPTLRMAQAAVRVAEARTTGARSVLLPQVVGTASYQRTTANLVARPGFVGQQAEQPAANWDTYNFFSFGVTATQLLYDFGQSTNALKAAKQSARAEAETLRAQRLLIDLGVRTSYFDAQAAKALVRVTQAALDNQRRHLEQVQAFVEVGQRPEIDLAQMRTAVANARVSLIQAENGYRLARLTLHQAMGVEGHADFEVADDALPELSEESFPFETLQRAAFEGRPELASLDRRVRAQELTVRSARGGYAPELVGSTALTKAGRELDRTGWNWNAGVALNWPLISGGQTVADTRVAEAQVESLRAERDDLRLRVSVEVEQARLDVIGAKALLEAAHEARASAESQLRLAEGRYTAGVGTIIELGDAELSFTGAEAQRVQAEFELARARSVLLRALGRFD